MYESQAYTVLQEVMAEQIAVLTGPGGYGENESIWTPATRIVFLQRVIPDFKTRIDERTAQNHEQ